MSEMSGPLSPERDATTRLIKKLSATMTGEGGMYQSAEAAGQWRVAEDGSLQRIAHES